MDLWNLAEQVASSYAHNPEVSATVVAGSVGRGRHDAFSDIEVDVYWAGAPTDQDRLAAVRESSGILKTLWDYDPEDAEWSEDFTVEGIPTTVSNFTCSEIEAVLGRQDTFTHLDQMRLSAIHTGRVVTGQDTVRTWLARSTYTDEVRLTTLRHFLTRVPLARWRHVPALASRGDMVSLRLVCDDMLLALLGLWFGLNKVYIEHPHFKWAHRVMVNFDCLPAASVERLRQACVEEPVAACEVAIALLQETLDLVEVHVPALYTADLRQGLATPRLTH